MLRTITAAGALILVHNLYGQAAAASRASMRLPMLGLALLWVFDLNLYTLQVLQSAARSDAQPRARASSSRSPHPASP